MLAIGTVYLAVAAVAAVSFVLLAAWSSQGDLLRTIVSFGAGICGGVVLMLALRYFPRQITPLIDALRSEHRQAQRGNAHAN